MSFAWMNILFQAALLRVGLRMEDVMALKSHPPTNADRMASPVPCKKFGSGSVWLPWGVR
jgi:hypothetical protein